MLWVHESVVGSSQLEPGRFATRCASSTQSIDVTLRDGMRDEQSQKREETRTDKMLSRVLVNQDILEDNFLATVQLSGLLFLKRLAAPGVALTNRREVDSPLLEDGPNRQRVMNYRVHVMRFKAKR